MRHAIAITLSKKAIKQLDELVKGSGLESRSRTIEEAILAIYDIKESFASSVEQCKHGKPTIFPDQAFVLLSAVNIILGRLSGFEKFHTHSGYSHKKFKSGESK